MAQRVNFGEKGIKWVKWLGEPRDFRGCVTGILYAFPPQYRTRGVDLRDLPRMVKDGGRENWEDIEGKTLEPEPEPKPKVTRQPVEPAPEPGEVAADG